MNAAQGSETMYGGAYGWGSAGKFHNAGAHLQRLLDLHGGFVEAFGNYSVAAGMTLLAHIVGALAPITGASYRLALDRREH